MNKIVMNTLSVLAVAVLVIACTEKPSTNGPQNGDNTPQEVNVAPELYFEGVSVPWGMTWLPDGDMLITDRSGKLLRVREGNLVAEISGVPDVYARSQGGLLDIALHPDYESNGWIYIAYSSTQGMGEGANTAIMRAKLENNALVQSQVLYKATPNTTRGQHYAGRIVFDSDGYLYFSVGDRGNRDELPQSLSKDGGKIYRLNDDGSVPDDNPFVGQEGAIEAMYSYGHRNPQGMAMHPETGKIWSHEHGPRGGDELNFIEAGKNYGWPVITYGINYNGTTITDETEKEGMEQPKTYWDPSIAPSGLDFVTSDLYPQWKGKAILGSLKFNYLVVVELDGTAVEGKEIVLEDIGRVRNVKQGPDGYIYVAVDGAGIYKIVPEN
ncbi:MAG: PQQ-dependent sugar dehydrogenase [Balneola sp.]|tara:strand:+ start:66110 stop:67255 length:1146 start_codon:yes stop_codon:yes gene_type:complete